MEASDILAVALAEQERALSVVAGLSRAPVLLSRATTRLGSYTWDPVTGERVIRVSRHLTSIELARDTARHELAHQAAHELHGHIGHGPPWQMWARYLGCEPKACSPGGIDPSAVKARFAVVCRACGWFVTRQTRSKLVRQVRRYACGSCGGPLAVMVPSV